MSARSDNQEIIRSGGTHEDFRCGTLDNLPFDLDVFGFVF
jgi:hypothetical protein